MRRGPRMLYPAHDAPRADRSNAGERRQMRGASEAQAVVARRPFMLAWPALALPQATAVRAQSSRRVFRIGMIETIPAAMNGANLDGFHRGMAERGMVEGRDYVIDYRVGEGTSASFPALAEDLVRKAVDVIVTRGTPAVIAARDATTTIPIVMAAVGDPAQVVTSITRPGGNITGFSSLTTELVAKRLSILRDLLPSLRVVASLTNLSNPSLIPEWAMLERIAPSFQCTPHLADVRRAQDIPGAFAGMRAAQADALAVSTDAVTQANRDMIVALAKRFAIPAIYVSREFTQAGGLMTYGVNYPDLYRRAAIYADRILKGMKPGDLPIEQPTRFEVVINLATAAALGLTLTPSVLALADELVD